MASLIKLKDLKDVVGNLLVVDGAEADNLINRAIARLYNQSSTPDSYVLVSFVQSQIEPYTTDETNVSPPALTYFTTKDFDINVDIGADGKRVLNWNHVFGRAILNENLTFDKRDGASYIGLSSAIYDSVIKFKYRGGIHSVIPLSSTFNEQGYDTQAFVDLGTVDIYKRIEDPKDPNTQNLPYRVYMLPSHLSNVEYQEIVALARVAFTKCVEDYETFPIRSLEAGRLAVMAVNYEEQNDMERASAYWASALNEMEAVANRYDTGRKHTVSFNPNAAANNLDTMY